jgi:hypothetical protein
VADGILLERQGVPTVSICTQSFRITGDAMARTYGFPGFEYVLVPHPVASLSAGELTERVERALPRIVEILGLEA